MNQQQEELSLYSHQITKQTLNKKKCCTLCNNTKSQLMKLPEEFQEYASKKGFESYYCSNCLQVINFCV